jgi:hypothetical protein
VKRTLLVQLCSYGRGNKSGKERHTRSSLAPFGVDSVELFLLKNFEREVWLAPTSWAKKLHLMVDDDSPAR